VASAVENVSAAYFATTVAPHEYFDQTHFRQRGPQILPVSTTGFCCTGSPNKENTARLQSPLRGISNVRRLPELLPVWTGQTSAHRLV
jgi:hypothetical protein